MTTTLLSAGKTAPRTIVGSVDTSEFLVSVSASLAFLIGLGTSGINFQFAGVLLLGGLLAAPLAAYAVLIYALFGSLTRALTRRHLWQLAASLAVALLSVVLVALGSPLSVGLVVLSFVPWVTVIAQERDARRKELSSDALALGASPHHRRV